MFYKNSCSAFKTKAFSNSTQFTKKCSTENARMETKCACFMELRKKALKSYQDMVLIGHFVAKMVLIFDYTALINNILNIYI